jgi:hypothetical protein
MVKKQSTLISEAIAEAQQVRKLAMEAAKDSLMETFKHDIEKVLKSKLHEAEEDEEEDLDEASEEDTSKTKKKNDTSDSDEEEISEMSDDELDEVIAELERELSEADDESTEDDVDSDTEDQEDELDEAEDEEEDSKKEKSIDELIEDFLREEEDSEESEEDLDEAEEETEEDKDSVKESATQDIITALMGLGALTATAATIDAGMKKLKSMAEKDPNGKAAKAHDFLEKIGRAASDSIRHEVAEEYETVVTELREAVKDVNLMNSKLLYSNKLFRNFQLSENQKKQVLESFDKATNVRETKLVFSTMVNSFNGAVKRTKNFSSAITESTKSKRESRTNILEVSGLKARFQELANIKKGK